MTQQEAKAIVYLDKGDYNFPVKETQKANSDKFILKSSCKSDTDLVILFLLVFLNFEDLRGSRGRGSLANHLMGC